MKDSDMMEIVPFPEPGATFETREVFRITRAEDVGGFTQISGERWDEALKRYRSTKPARIQDGISSVSIEFADDDLEAL